MSTLEFWFEYGSTYTYLSVARIERLAARCGVTIEWRPFLLMPILLEVGMDKGPFLGHPAKLRYMWADLERRAKRHGLPYRRPSHYPPNTLQTARVGLLAAREGWGGRFTMEAFRLHWTEDIRIGTAENLSAGISKCGEAPERVLRMSTEANNREALRQQTERAKRLGIFGSPTFIVNGALFWGDDRLEDALGSSADASLAQSG